MLAETGLTFQQQPSLLAQNLHQPLIQLHLLQQGQQLLLIANHFVLGIQSLRKGPLLSQPQQCHFQCQSQVGLSRAPWHWHVLVGQLPLLCGQV